MQVGAVVGGKWKITALLGQGATCTVYAACDTKIDTIRRALKVIDPQLATDEEFRRRFFEEVRVLAELKRHPNLCAETDYLEYEDHLVLLTELLPGRTLQKTLDDAKGLLDIEQVSDWLSQILDGLQYAHARGILHRDIKPGNLFLCDDGTIKLIDFGLAKRVAETQLTKTGRLVGTPTYLAPELAERPAHPGSDIYALGITAYQLLTGKIPYEISSSGDQILAMMKAHLDGRSVPIQKRRPDVPPAMAALVHKAIEKDPEKRFKSASEMLLALETMDNRVPPRDRDPLMSGIVNIESWDKFREESKAPPPPPPPKWLGVHRRTWLNSVLVVVVAFLAAAGVFFATKPPGTHRRAPEPSPTPAVVLPVVASTRTPAPTPAPIPPPFAGMLLVPGGTFLMGCTEGDRRCQNNEKPKHQVTLQEFWLDAHEVTVEDYGKCIEDGHCTAPASHSDNRFNWKNKKRDLHPVNNVSWVQANQYCQWKDSRLRLPTEAEFEWVLRRGGQNLIFPWGDSSKPPDGFGNYDRNDQYRGTAPVCSFQPQNVDCNSREHVWDCLCDISGNVWEWCADWYGDYADGAASNPTGPQTGTERVIRGGGFWQKNVWELRTSQRQKQVYDERGGIATGFRCAMDAH